MTIFNSTSQNQGDHVLRSHPPATAKMLTIMTGLIALSCVAFSPAWAGDYTSIKTSSGAIQLTSLSIQIGPGGFHLGIGVPYYGPVYVRPHVHVRPAPRPYWKPPSHHGQSHYYAAPQRFNHRQGWKNDRHGGNFRGNGGRRNGGHSGGGRR